MTVTETLKQAHAALLRIRTASIAGCEEGYGKPEKWADELFTSHGDVTAAMKAIEALLSSDLAQCQQEPVAWRWNTRADQRWRVTINRPVPNDLTAFDKIEPLYAAVSDTSTLRCPPMPELKYVREPCHMCGAVTEGEAEMKCRPSTDQTGERYCGCDTFDADGYALGPTLESMAAQESWYKSHHSCSETCSVSSPVENSK
jgi:hypothetical protein